MGSVKDKIGDVFLRADKSRCHAYWRPIDGADVFLCAIDLSAYNNHPHLRELFTELATEVAINRACGSGVMLRVREPLPATVRYSPL
jgi:hypothetical protein